jgi:hypothetical protein
MEKLEPLLHMMVQELGAAATGALVLVGDKLGLYQALAEHGPLSAKALAEKTGTLTEVLKEAGFARVRRAADTPFNMILEARP